MHKLNGKPQTSIAPGERQWDDAILKYLLPSTGILTILLFGQSEVYCVYTMYNHRY